MQKTIPFDLYEGKGRTVSRRDKILPPYEPLTGAENPADYIADEGLCKAVNVALALGQPLLVTGDPGCGKTRLAHSMAFDLELGEPLIFHTKTTSAAADLFYYFDTLGRFHDAHSREQKAADPEKYVTYQALGLAILLAQEKGKADAFLPKEFRGKGPTRSLVLIDEIDKAPRDLPNDILNEIEKMSFSVRETGRSFSADQAFRPVILLTSNSEKNLPDAFLRRCVFYHISFPDEKRLGQILQKRFGKEGGLDPEFVKNLIRHFEKIRDIDLKKKPSTAEFLAWVRVMQSMEIKDPEKIRPEQTDMLALSYSVLAKSEEDLRRLKRETQK